MAGTAQSVSGLVGEARASRPDRREPGKSIRDLPSSASGPIFHQMNEQFV